MNRVLLAVSAVLLATTTAIMYSGVVTAQSTAPAPVTCHKDVLPILWEEMHFPSYGVIVDDIVLTQRDIVARGGFVGGEGVPPQRGN